MQVKKIKSRLSQCERLAHSVQRVRGVWVWGADLPVWPGDIALQMTLFWTPAFSDQFEAPLRVTHSSPSLMMLIYRQYFYFQMDFLSHCLRGWWAACQPRCGPQKASAREASSPRGCAEAGAARSGVKCRGSRRPFGGSLPPALYGDC